MVARCNWMFLTLLCTGVTVSAGLYANDDFLFQEDVDCIGDEQCVEVTKCQVAIDELRVKRRHSQKRCGFTKDDMELVCCIFNKDDFDTSSTTQTTVENSTDMVEERGPVIRKSKLACDEYTNEISGRVNFHILGGVDVELKELPHMAGLGFRNPDNPDDEELLWICGGSLISRKYVLTAAHCSATRNGKPIKVRLGVVDIQGTIDKHTPSDFDVNTITLHPEYNKRKKINDIALILLEKEVTTSDYIYPACLYQSSNDPPGILVSGWGLTENGGVNSPILQKVSLITMDLDKCNSTHINAPLGKAIYSSQLCAISNDGRKDACGGDSGGPMQVQSIPSSTLYSIVGIVSYGRGCGGSFPGVYTRVFSYLDWIEKIVWP